MSEFNTTPEDLGLLYSHISRMYNSAINALISIIFGWLAFIGIIAKVQLPRGYIIATTILVVSMASYFFYFRILRQGRYIARIEKDLGFKENYIPSELLPLNEKLPLGRYLRHIGERKNDDPEKWNLQEILSLVFIISFFLMTITFSILPVLKG